jgi:indolepyruvate ferredoxin oxidoreductase, alpha subunit
MKRNQIKELCLAPADQSEVLQGNIAFAVGCVRAGIHAVEGYPGTPSTEVIDRGLSQVQDLVTVGWSVNEAVAVGLGVGHTLAGRDAVVTMKIPGLFQAGDIFTSSAFFHDARGALIYYIASDFTPSSTQHLVDPRPLFKSCALPVFEPSSHQEMLEAAAIAVDVARTLNTPVVILASGALCHSEGLVRLNPVQRREPVEVGDSLRKFNCLPGVARQNYDAVMTKRLPALKKMVEESSHVRWFKGSGRKGIITSGANAIFAREAAAFLGTDVDILSLGFTHPLPVERIRAFCAAVSGDIHVIEDGSRYLQDELRILGLDVKGKSDTSTVTEYSPAMVALTLGCDLPQRSGALQPVPRPPMICAGCPYLLFANSVRKLKKRGKIAHVFGDIGCNSLLFFMHAMDTGVAMGASEAKRAGFVLSRPDMADRCISIIGDSTECHSGLDATRNTVFRKVPGVKIVLDNYWTAMTGGQPAPSSPVDLAGQPNTFDLAAELEATGARTVVVDAYDRKQIRNALSEALKGAGEKIFTTLVVRGSCMKKVPEAQKRIKLTIDQDKCQRCYTCRICAGNQKGADGFPVYNNLCTGCGDHTPACLQMCPFGAISEMASAAQGTSDGPTWPTPPLISEPKFDTAALPGTICLAIRGVGGQGNLFFGRVLTQMAFLAGYAEKNIVKGETHGMAQMGGPVISTFACGAVHSPVLMPGAADCLISMEIGELLRPGFLELLKPGGTILSASTVIVPQDVSAESYPAQAAIQQAVEGRRLIVLDVLAEAFKLDDKTGRIANVVMLGALSKIVPFSAVPAPVWLQALKAVTPPVFWAANYHAFQEGRAML